MGRWIVNRCIVYRELAQPFWLLMAREMRMNKNKDLMLNDGDVTTYK